MAERKNKAAVLDDSLDPTISVSALRQLALQRIYWERSGTRMPTVWWQVN
jgi:hypothetical protein